MKTTDFSKLHLAKRVYFRDGTEEIVKSFNRTGIREFPYLINGQKYLPDGCIWYVSANEKDIIAFDIDEPELTEKYFLDQPIRLKSNGLLDEKIQL